MNNLKKKSSSSLIAFCIIFILFSIILFMRSIKDLFGIFKYGIYKKEILTKESDLGFDVKIRFRR